jgi:hypothetical protein
MGLTVKEELYAVLHFYQWGLKPVFAGEVDRKSFATYCSKFKLDGEQLV